MNILDFVGKYAESNNIKYIEKPKINEKGPPEYDFFKKSPEEKTYLSQLEKQADELMAKQKNWKKNCKNDKIYIMH